MKIHPKKQEYLNSEIFNYVELLESSKESNSKEKYSGSVTLKGGVDLSKYLINQPRIISQTNGERIVSKKECFESSCLGLNETNYSKFVKFIKSIHKDKNFNDTVSFNFFRKNNL